MISQILIIMLAIDAAWVAYLLSRKRTAFNWIFIYWIILTAKNFCDLMRW